MREGKVFLIDMFNKKTVMPTAETALPGRVQSSVTAEIHFVSGRRLQPPYPDNFRLVYFGMGRFWGPERLFWQIPGVWVTAVGYQGGFTQNPTFQETIAGLTGHAEVVKLVYDQQQVSLNDLLKVFFEAHDPTQGMRQGNAIGSMYRSVVHVTDRQDLDVATRVRDRYQQALFAAGHSSRITTEIAETTAFYYAEEYHQQYLARNAAGNSPMRGTGVVCPLA